MFLILASRKLRQEDCHVLKISVDYRVSLKTPKAIEHYSHGRREGFLLQTSSLTVAPFHFLMTRWFVWVLVALLAGEMFTSHLHFFSSELSSELFCNELFRDAFVLSCLYILDINNILTIELSSKPFRKQLVTP